MITTRLQQVKDLSSTVNHELFQRDLEKMSKTVKNREEKLKRDAEDIRLKNMKKVENISHKQRDLQKRQKEQYNYYMQKQELRD